MKGDRALRFMAFAEAITLLLLVFVAMPLKYGAGYLQATSIMGPIHGITFLLFIWLVIRTHAEGLISSKDLVRLTIGAMVPFGGIVNERWLRTEMAKRTT